MVREYLIVMATSTVATLCLTPVVRRVAQARDLMVKPVGSDERHVHERPTPALGGVAMYIGVLVGLATAWALDEFEPAFDAPTQPLGVLGAATVAFAVGLVDDLRKIHRSGVSAPAKMSGLVLAGSILAMAGVSAIYFRVPFFGVFSLSPDLAAFVTVLWVVGMANALNLIDGLDGLAAGITAIAAGAFLIYSLRLDHEGFLIEGNAGPLFAVLVLGACIGFLPHNVHPARIFMGDSGALLLGVLMAASTTSVGGSTDTSFEASSFFFLAPLFIPLVILGVPVLDTLFAIVRRASRRAGVATADKDHLHHRLLKLGHGHRRAVFILWAWTALLSLVVLVPVYSRRGTTLIPLGVAALGLALYTVLHPQIRQRNGTNGHGNGAVPEAAAPPVAAHRES